MDHRFYDLKAMDPRQGRAIEFTEKSEERWSGVVELLPGQGFTSRSGYRTDVYILHGEITRGAGHVSAMGDYLSIYGDGELTGAFGGAVLLIYREPVLEQNVSVDLPAVRRPWRNGRISGMHIADLTTADHQVALIHWRPGIYVPPHINPRGEEVFVLSGSLQVNGCTFPAGSWLRLGSGERHDSGSTEPALILLRSGHLDPVH